MAKIECSRCGEVMLKYEWYGHVFNGMRDITKLPIDILKRLASKAITENKAFELAEKGK